MTNQKPTSSLDLYNYARKYGVSVSTLRRRVRSKTIPFKLFKGRYWLEDSANTIRLAPLFSRGSNDRRAKGRLLAVAPLMAELLTRGLECGVFDDAPVFKNDVQTALNKLKGEV